MLTSGYHGWHDWHLQIFPRLRFPDAIHFDFGYNLNLLEKQLRSHRDDVACIILTPEPTFFDDDYLREVEQIAKAEGVLLIFDEVVSGFCYGVGGVQAKSGVVPDLATIGKGLANGYGLSAVIGREDVLEARNCTRLVGTYQHEIPPMVAALATTEVFLRERVAERLTTVGT